LPAEQSLGLTRALVRSLELARGRLELARGQGTRLALTGQGAWVAPTGQGAWVAPAGQGALHVLGLPRLGHMLQYKSAVPQ